MNKCNQQTSNNKTIIKYKFIKSHVPLNKTRKLTMETFAEDQEYFVSKHKSLFNIDSRGKFQLLEMNQNNHALKLVSRNIVGFKDISIQTKDSWHHILNKIIEYEFKKHIESFKLKQNMLSLGKVDKCIIAVEKSVPVEVQYEHNEQNHKNNQTTFPDDAEMIKLNKSTHYSEMSLNDKKLDQLCHPESNISLSLTTGSKHSSQCCCIDCITKV